MRSLAFLLIPLLAAGCADTETVSPEVAAVRAVTMATTPVSWHELRIHPTLRRNACATTTLVNESGTTVGYCRNGRQCRTNDWRPIEDGCIGPPGQGIARDSGAPRSTQAALRPPQ